MRVGVTGWAEARQRPVQGREVRPVLYRPRVRSRACIWWERGLEAVAAVQVQVKGSEGRGRSGRAWFWQASPPTSCKAASYHGARREN